MSVKLRFNYYPGMPAPNKLTTSPRAFRAWEESKREYEERQEAIRQAEERLAKRGATTPAEFRQQEAADNRSAQQRPFLKLTKPAWNASGSEKHKSVSRNKRLEEIVSFGHSGKRLIRMNEISVSFSTPML